MDGWKWRCHKLMLLDILLCLVVWSNDCGINFKPQIQCLEDLLQADHELQHSRKSLSSTFNMKKENHCCIPICYRSFCRIGKKNLSHYSTKTPA